MIFLLLVIIYEVATSAPRRGEYTPAAPSVQPRMSTAAAADAVRFAAAATSAESGELSPPSSTWAANYYLRDSEQIRMERMDVHAVDLAL